jgi:hypothetical protein
VTSAHRPWLRPLAVAALFIVLTGIMTWPQPLVLATHATDHHDIFFNLWRLGWVHHALTSPAELFNGNQFYPEDGVLAYSDAMLVEGAIAAPALALGMRPLLVHNLLLLGAIAGSGIGMFWLARRISGSDAGAVIAGLVFAFAPYRFEHYMHMELQWAVWSPWAFWSLQRTLDTGTTRFGLLTGAFVALQMLSSIYYSIFLGLLLAIVAVLQLIALPRPELFRRLRSLAAGGLLAVCVAGIYSAPYSSAARRVGDRGPGEVRTFSARPRNYLSATETNLLYGSRRRSVPERRLFPGVLPFVLALVALLLVKPTVPTISYLIGLVAAFELSLGLNGMIYPSLYDHVAFFRGLRAPARASIFFLLCLGVLAAQGYKALAAAISQPARHVLAIALPAIVLLEYWVAPLRLIPYMNEAPPLYAWLADQPAGVVAEFPMPRANQLPGEDARHLYMSTFHWLPLVNGYSGYYPPSYIGRLERVRQFPDGESLQQLQRDRVRYVIVHETGYEAGEYSRVLEGLAKRGLSPVGRFADGWGSAVVFELR